MNQFGHEGGEDVAISVFIDKKFMNIKLNKSLGKLLVAIYHVEVHHEVTELVRVLDNYQTVNTTPGLSPF